MMPSSYLEYTMETKHIKQLTAVAMRYCSVAMLPQLFHFKLYHILDPRVATLSGMNVGQQNICKV